MQISLVYLDLEMINLVKIKQSMFQKSITNFILNQNIINCIKHKSKGLTKSDYFLLIYL